VDSLNRPGANVTGVTTLAGPLGAKRLELLRELVPKATTVGLLVNPNNTNSEPETVDILAGARTIGLKTHTMEASDSDEVARAFAKLTELKAGALLVYGDPIFFLLRNQIVLLAAQSAVPTIYNAREFVQDGGLISYGASFTVAFRQCGNYVGRIRLSASICRLHCSPAPTRCSNKAFLPRCLRPLLAHFGHGAMSDLSPLCSSKRTSGRAVTKSANDPTQTLRRHSAGDTPVETSQLLIAVLEA
jgi:hypothetical protein